MLSGFKRRHYLQVMTAQLGFAATAKQRALKLGGIHSQARLKACTDEKVEWGGGADR
jgi:hypothetical protein